MAADVVLVFTSLGGGIALASFGARHPVDRIAMGLVLLSSCLRHHLCNFRIRVGK